MLAIFGHVLTATFICVTVASMSFHGGKSFQPTFCKTQTLVGNLTMFNDGAKVYEIPMEWIQDNQRQILKIKLLGVADFILTRENKFIRRSTGDNYACTLSDGVYSDLCNFYHFTPTTKGAADPKNPNSELLKVPHSRSFKAHALPLGLDVIFPHVKIWQIAFTDEGDRIAGLLGLVNDDMQYVFTPVKSNKAALPMGSDLGIPEECLISAQNGK